MIKRNHEKALKDWFFAPKTKPLIIRGARQVGKSTLVRTFCKNHGFDLHEINFEITSLKSLKKLENLDLQLVIQEVEAITKKRVNEKTSVIFFDELQANPVALQALRYFYESDKNYKIVCAGSLLEFLLEDHSFSMPVGRIDFIHLGPVTFFEFLEALGETIAVDQLLTFDPKFFHLHRELMEKRLREYFFVGGMPQAIQCYLDTKSVLEVSKIHSSILQTYKFDFSRYKTRLKTNEIGRIFDLLPKALGKKIKYASLFLDEKSKIVNKVLELFSMAKIISKCIHTNASSIPLSSTSDPTVFKIYYLDIGLLHHLQGLLPEELLVDRKDSVSNVEGLSAEQFVAQHLLYAQPHHQEAKLYYWLKDKAQTKAEVDFLINKGKQIIPIEVKSGKSGSLKSLFHFMETHEYNLAYRFFLGQDDNSFFTETTSKGFKINHLPLWMIEKVFDIPN